MKQEILSDIQIEQKTNRLAHQIIENCFEEKELFIAGISGNGYSLAKRLSEIINEHGLIKSHLTEVKVNKSEPWSEEITLDSEIDGMKNAVVILVDDVVNSGKTMQFALTKFLTFPTKAIKTVTLVDRKHRRFPIRVDFVGLSLSTTLKERVEVVMEDAPKAYLV
jgi:pyrimidine operon attenuation protein/uracil phosphoribosyltransferase